MLPSSNSSHSEPISLYPTTPTLPVSDEQQIIPPKSSLSPPSLPHSNTTVSPTPFATAFSGNSNSNSHEDDAGASSSMAKPSAQSNTEEDDILTDLIDIKVGQPQRIGDGFSSYVTYALHTKVRALAIGETQLF